MPRLGGWVLCIRDRYYKDSETKNTTYQDVLKQEAAKEEEEEEEEEGELKE